MREFYEYLRYDRPVLFKVIVTACITVLALGLFMTIPDRPLAKAVGITSAQTRLSAGWYWAKWNVRATTNRAAGAPLRKTIYGTIEGIDRDGFLVVSIPTGPRFQKSKVVVADIKILDLFGAAELIQGMRGMDARLEYYGEREVVAWVDNAPLNVKLIEAGFAIPDPNPPTNIVDQAFASHYWRIFHGD